METQSPSEAVIGAIAVKRRLLILDLDETLIHAAETELDRPCDFRVGPFFVYKRPYTDAFLAGCLALFDVAVWTSASPEYARYVAAHLLPDPSRLVFLWASNRCSRGFDSERHEHYWRKSLTKLRRLRRAKGWTRGDILAVDDSPEKWEQSFGNLIRVVPFTGNAKDDVLPRLLVYLEQIANVPDFRRIDKRFWHTDSSPR